MLRLHSLHRRKTARILVTSVLFFTLWYAVYNYIQSHGNSLSTTDYYRDYLKQYLKSEPSTLGVSQDIVNPLEKGEAGEEQAVHIADRRRFYNKIFQLLLDQSPRGKSERRYREECNLHGDVGNGPDQYGEWWKLTYEELANCLEVSETEKTRLHNKHRQYVRELRKLVLPRGTYTGSGIVTVAGGKYTLMALLVIETLRSTGTTLPVEVFIPPDTQSRETEAAFCDELLPQYNAKCIYIDDILSRDMIDKFEFKGYQFKSLALLASSFENVLFLDADNFPIKPLDDIFDKEPFTSTGLVLWPDFWRRTTNPVFYDIADLQVDRTRRVRNSVDDLTPLGVYNPPDYNLGDVPFHDFEGAMPDPSTESGQIMVNKNKHLGTVLLSLYYNVNGPSWYYSILSQRAAGEGDKETFIAAAMFYGLPFYQVKTPVGVEGYFHPIVETDEDGNEHRKTGDFRGVAMLQYDFVHDYNIYKEAQLEIQKKYANSNDIQYDPEYTVDRFCREYLKAPLDTMFVHANFPKFDVVGEATGNEFVENGEHLRSFTALKKLGYYDIELENFKLLDRFLCATERYRHFFVQVSGSVESGVTSWDQICGYVASRLAFLRETHDAAVRPAS